jgi:Flp pilus assembly protein TadD
MMRNPKKLSAVLCMTALLALASCKGMDPTHEAVDSMRGMHEETQQRLSEQARDAVASGHIEEAVRFYASLHKQHPHDRGTALVYAQLLRRAGRPAEAVKVLTPFASFHTVNNESNRVVIYNSDAVVLNELAAADIATGDFPSAESLLSHVLSDPSSAPLHPDAYSLMGIVQDAKGDHKQAEQMFHKALEGWKGDPTPVMNNLALCLAAQGQFDAALDTLRRALVISPNDKQEIARNIALITDLRGNIVTKAVVVKKVITPKVKVKKTVHKKSPACGPCPVPAQPEKPK